MGLNNFNTKSSFCYGKTKFSNFSSISKQKSCSGMFLMLRLDGECVSTVWLLGIVKLPSLQYSVYGGGKLRKGSIQGLNR